MGAGKKEFEVVFSGSLLAGLHLSAVVAGHHFAASGKPGMIGSDCEGRDFSKEFK